MSDTDDSRTLHLLENLVDGRLPAEEVKALAHQLMDNESLQDALIDTVLFETSLTHCLLSEAGIDPGEAGVRCGDTGLGPELGHMLACDSPSGAEHAIQGRRPVERNTASTSQRVFLSMALVASVALIVGSLSTFVMLRSIAPPQDPMAVKNRASSASDEGFDRSPRRLRLVAATGCVWGPSQDGSPSIGASMDSGREFMLHEGIADLQLQVSDGLSCRVRVEGPASLSTERDGTLLIASGAVTVDTAWLHEPVDLGTPLGRVTIMPDSSIGLVAAMPQVAVHTFKGKAEIVPRPASALVGGDSMVVAKGGEAITVARDLSGSISVDRSAASEGDFLSSRSMVFDSLAITQAYVDAVLSSRPAIYWRFENESEFEFINQGELSGMTLRASQGVRRKSYRGNGFIELGLSPVLGTLTTSERWPTRSLDKYTAEMWVKPSHYHKGMALSCIGPLYRNGRLVGESHGLAITTHGALDSLGPCAFYFIHRSPIASLGPPRKEGCLANDHYSVREWQHVVARKDGPEIRLFVDGTSVDRNRYEKALPTGLRIVIGALSEYHKAGRRQFIGQIDEVALYEHALSDEEIRQHFELAGRPARPARNTTRPLPRDLL